ncbi:hypothetical protein pEaSNUABM50_00243 [Erwinia phage pEa_SNUABM_50]|uniref:Uncharacterized protein n=4 Tax=Eneladusvirus BF TaxID=2560751 RepID=A0A7L8ZNB4_9CAUD|nr:hypothetical protein FDH34_gp247 [Serratia phage BF]QOI71184.1 hypothetical protein pEaSNUABM12_00246 [Erwinia phage pEa_SNUABM_12]QOI71728.1 hypothetical protein pEaSNUABM47_00244 [Erwinia phage pEa_SNUABM_47]QOI72267.1 hypothetical protein pEaSNUABM50_00243 [Erwinia phage pEa_SNUABM_50]QXO11393.1 hypothetical protein pEaSNUABM19_00247 [Erwinia phage pEa_SNUABM_19]QXO12494.1 hypothetical protein pEaSNUABM49_00248 [Erwinia phage pEa_SNUABM_49]
MKEISELRFNCEEIKNSLMEVAVHIPNTSYEMLLNMPVNDKDLMVKQYNKKIKRENKKS